MAADAREGGLKEKWPTCARTFLAALRSVVLVRLDAHFTQRPGEVGAAVAVAPFPRLRASDALQGIRVHPARVDGGGLCRKPPEARVDHQRRRGRVARTRGVLHTWHARASVRGRAGLVAALGAQLALARPCRGVGAGRAGFADALALARAGAAAAAAVGERDLPWRADGMHAEWVGVVILMVVMRMADVLSLQSDM